MASNKLRIVHYINQFFGGIGGEDKADIGPFAKEGTVGPGMALAAATAECAEVVGTVVCGDSYFNENLEKATAEVLERVKAFQPDIVVTGPAFNAGRYGMAAGAVAKAVTEHLGVPVVSGMYPENPGVELYRKYAFIVETGNSAAAMRAAVPAMAVVIKKLAAGKQPLPGPDYMPRGLRKNFFASERGAKRAVNLLVKRLRGDHFSTEYPMPVFDRVEPNQAIKDLTRAKVAFVTSGGIVPKGNPDRIEASSASKFGKYSLADLTDFNPDNSQTAHGGYDPVYANQDADRVVPLDAARELEKEGVIGKIHDYWYATVGNGTSVANARKFAAAIAEDLRQYDVDAVVLTST